MAPELGVGRSTVDRALAAEGPPKYERQLPVATSSSPFEALGRALLVERPELPATVIAARVGGCGSITVPRRRASNAAGASTSGSGGPADVGAGGAGAVRSVVPAGPDPDRGRDTCLSAGAAAGGGLLRV